MFLAWLFHGATVVEITTFSVRLDRGGLNREIQSVTDVKNPKSQL